MIKSKYPSYCIIGNGKLASFLNKWLSSKNRRFVSWKREDEISSLKMKIADVDYLLLSVTDKSIPFFLDLLKDVKDYRKIHFSNCLSFDSARGFGPVFSFSNRELNSEELYSVPFLIENNVDNFTEVFPDYPNRCIKVDTKMKPIIHAHLVLAGNCSTLLWQNFKKKMGSVITKEFCDIYRESIFKNLSSSDEVMTGPMVRGDLETINANLKSIKNKPEEDIYKAFYQFYNALYFETRGD